MKYFIILLFLSTNAVAQESSMLLQLEEWYGNIDLDPEKSIRICDSLIAVNKKLTLQEQTFIYHIMSDAYYYLDDLGMSDKMIIKALELVPADYEVKKHIMMLNAHGQNVFSTGKNAEAIEIYSKAIPLAKSIQDDQELSYLFDNIANAYLALSQYGKASNYLDSAMQQNFLLKDSSGIISNIQMQSGIYKNIEDFKNATAKIKSAYSFVPSTEKHLKNLIHIRVAGSFYGAELYDSMTVYLHKVDTSVVRQYARLLQLDYINLWGSYYLSHGDTTKALTYFDSCAVTASNFGNAFHYYHSKIQSFLYNVNEDTDLSQINNTLQKIEAFGLTSMARIGYDQLAFISNKLGENQRAYDALRKSLELGKSEDRSKTQNKIAKLMVDYDLLEKEYRTQLAEEKVESRKKQLLAYGLAIGSLLLLAMGILQYRNRRTKLKLEKEKLDKEKKLMQEIAEVESRAFRAQMNPHFIFNALNSIKGLIIQKETDEAAAYISDFSKLVRSILDNSMYKTIPLINEIDTLSKYINLESMRFQGVFNSKIEVSPDLDIDHLQIPPTIIQPFVENAIWHGFVNNPRPNQLLIKLELKNESLFITIEDNGVGRSTNTEQKVQQSHGVKISRQRIWNFSEDKLNNRLVYIDLIKDDRPVGTKVILKLPLKY